MHLSIRGQCDANHRMRPRNADLRRRDYLTEAEVERLMEAAKGNPWGHRDAAMVLVAYRHGLRASELVDLHWDQVDFRTATLHVRRVKKGTPSTHPILGDELRALRRLQREQAAQVALRVHLGAGAPFTTAGFARMVERAGSEAKLGFKAHPHMLRHACGYALANRGHDTRALQAISGTATSSIRCAIPIGPDAVQGLLAELTCRSYPRAVMTRRAESFRAAILTVGLFATPTLASAQLKESPITPGFWSFPSQKTKTAKDVIATCHDHFEIRLADGHS